MTAGSKTASATDFAADDAGGAFAATRTGARSMRLDAGDALGPGRLGVYSALGAATWVVPVPWLPGALGKRIAGALVQDVAARHGLSLTPEAREILSSPFGATGERGVVSQALRFAAGKFLSSRFTPVAFVAPLRNAAFTFALGHLFARYIETRKAQSIRVDAEEARSIRRLVDDALVTTLSFDLAGEPLPRPTAPDDQRDQATRVVDGVLIATASVPDWVLRRLDAAFDRCARGAGSASR